MEIQIRQGITIIVPGCRDAAITCWVNEDTDTLMQLKIAHFSSVAWPAYFTSIRMSRTTFITTFITAGSNKTINVEIKYI